MSRYEVTTVDLCVQGFERLRSPSEFILCAYPAKDETPAELVAELLGDIQACMRPDDFDFDGARAAVESYFDEPTQANLARELRGIDWPEDDDSEDDPEGNPLILFVYVRDSKADEDEETDSDGAE